ncbi:hypothetical protein FZC76_15955 [Sutcliffiella horikoshii]|uniref:Uncharacterized protein n=1 Tax=Sutcliffiella horikoshii TaxID=79883 RepID=A0A5D4SWI1_9BACI|nr:hypothetical protein [Sutcliffiella horikoshii]TYS67021.1 hypothetical protein FZC76_15955 [Sutcliffiella horikoshii]
MSIKIKMNKNLEKEIMQKAKKIAEDKLRNSGVNRECPHCKKVITMKTGLNVCPYCKNKIDLQVNH